tara:strand:- start:10558 stop:10881 length:324 start_codon:yes stop_codon:yes gene_type:complete
MKIKSNLVMNTSILAPHSPSSIDGKVVIGGGVPVAVNIPAGSTIEIDDAVWLKDFAKAATDLISSGSLSILEEVKLSKADLAKAKKARAVALKAELAKLETAETNKE